MNQHSSISSTEGVSAEAISRRAYEIWEREGRPEGCDLRHWLEAEQELGIRPTDTSRETARTAASEPANVRSSIVDTQPPQMPRAGAGGSRETKRPPTPSNTPPASGNGSGKRKPSNAPIL